MPPDRTGSARAKPQRAAWWATVFNDASPRASLAGPPSDPQMRRPYWQAGMQVETVNLRHCVPARSSKRKGCPERPAELAAR